MPDFRLANHGSIYVLTPRTPAAVEWIASHIPQNRTEWAGGVVIETRYLYPILDGITNDGLTLHGNL